MLWMTGIFLYIWQFLNIFLNPRLLLIVPLSFFLVVNLWLYKKGCQMNLYQKNYHDVLETMVRYEFYKKHGSVNY